MAEPVTVIVPAHNEATVLGELLTNLTSGALEGSQIIVAANGCTDSTADIAREHGVTVLELTTPSKTAALNAAERIAEHFPRFYVDADISITGESIRAVADAMRDDPSICLAGPRPVPRVDQASRLVKSHYRASRFSDYALQASSSTGVFALSEAGRARFRDFPDVIADDTFVKDQFDAAEVLEVKAAVAYVDVPRTMRELIRRANRVAAGNRQLDALQLRRVGPGGRQARYGRFLRRAATSPRDWPAVGLFLSVRALTTVNSRRASRSLGAHWSPDR